MNTTITESVRDTDGYAGSSIGSGADGSAGHGVATNGGALAAFLGAGIGALAMGLVVVLNELGLLPVPALHAPSGGVSSRTTLATIIWVIGWAILHRRWEGRQIAPRPVHFATAVLILMGLLLTFPPVWGLL